MGMGLINGTVSSDLLGDVSDCFANNKVFGRIWMYLGLSEN